MIKRLNCFLSVSGIKDLPFQIFAYWIPEYFLTEHFTMYERKTCHDFCIVKLDDISWFIADVVLSSESPSLSLLSHRWLF